MKYFFLFSAMLIFCNNCFATPREQRIKSELAAIGAYIADKHGEFAESQLAITKQTMSQMPRSDELKMYYTGDYEAHFAAVANNSTTDAAVELGKEYVEKILKKHAKKFCSKFGLCKLPCYADVMGEVLDLLEKDQPELLPIKAIFQAYIIDGGMKYLSTLCSC